MATEAEQVVEAWKANVIAASKAIAEAKSIEDVRVIWKAYKNNVGHRILGQMLLGREAFVIIAKKGVSA